MQNISTSIPNNNNIGTSKIRSIEIRLIKVKWRIEKIVLYIISTDISIIGYMLY